MACYRWSKGVDSSSCDLNDVTELLLNFSCSYPINFTDFSYLKLCELPDNNSLLGSV